MPRLLFLRSVGRGLGEPPTQTAAALTSVPTGRPSEALIRQILDSASDGVKNRSIDWILKDRHCSHEFLGLASFC
jgi:hypothetical protein